MKGYEIKDTVFVKYIKEEEATPELVQDIIKMGGELNEIELLECDCGRLFPETFTSVECPRCEKITFEEHEDLEAEIEEIMEDEV